MRYVNRAMRPLEVMMYHEVSGLTARQKWTHTNKYGNSKSQNLKLFEPGLKRITSVFT